MIVFNDFVLIEPTLEEQTNAGLYLVDIVDKQLRKGKVIGFGSECKNQSQMEDLLGQEVMYAVSGGFAGFGDPVKVTLGKVKYDLVTQKQLVLVMPEAEKDNGR